MSDRPLAAHLPVMVGRIVELLAVTDDRRAVLVDATVGAGGHAAALLAASSAHVSVIGFDRDPEALELARHRLDPFGERATLVHAGYDELARRVPPIAGDRPVLGVLYDLGVSSMQLDRADRGFSFSQDGPLDMRMDPGGPLTAADLVNQADEPRLARVIAALGEERFARRIARAIVAARPLERTAELAEVVARAVPAATRRTGLHPATRTFQALRIEVNGELDRFRASLPQALELAAGPAAPSARGGRLAILSYHSLEDRPAKRFLADAATGCICPPDLPVCGCGRTPLVRQLTRGAETAAEAEVRGNPRARSAKLRAVEVLTSRVAPEIPPDPGSGLHDSAGSGSGRRGRSGTPPETPPEEEKE